MLVETARRVNSAIRHSDVLVRWEAEEFLVVSRLPPDRRQGEILAQRVLDAVRESHFAISPEDKLLQTCSIGWAAFPWIEDTVDADGIRTRAEGQGGQGTLQGQAGRERPGCGDDSAERGAGPSGWRVDLRKPDSEACSTAPGGSGFRAAGRVVRKSRAPLRLQESDAT